MKTFGSGPVLKDACRWLRDDAQRHKRILEVTERDSVIEGLPPFQEETRERMLKQLTAMTGPSEAPQQ